MKAVQIHLTGGPNVLLYVDIPIPVLAPGEVLVKTHAIGVAYPDILVRSGRYPWMPKLPYIPGNEATGRVVDANGSARLKNGQPVFFTSWDTGFAGGFYAEYVAVRDTAPWVLPDGIDLDEASALFNYIVAWLLLNCAARGVDANTIFIHGASGGVGTALIDLGNIAGAAVIGSASTDEKCDFIKRRGAAYAINHKEVEAISAKVLELTNDRGADVIFNHIAGNSFIDDLKMVAKLGMIVSDAVLGGMPDSDLFRAMRANLNRSPALRVMTTHTFDQMPEIRNKACETVIALLAERKIRPAITTRLPLAEAARAHAMIEGRTSIGKILLKP